MSDHGDTGRTSAQQTVVDRVAADGYYPDGSVKMSHAFALLLHGCPPPPASDAQE